VITTNVIQRTFHVRTGDSIGTCFTVDIDEKQYIVTAKHVASDIIGTTSISIFHDNQWKNIDVTLIGHCDSEIDISVLTTNLRLSPDFALPPTMGGIIYGQDVYSSRAKVKTTAF
jgi:S1-C subfamily serine protease